MPFIHKNGKVIPVGLSHGQDIAKHVQKTSGAQRSNPVKKGAIGGADAGAITGFAVGGVAGAIRGAAIQGAVGAGIGAVVKKVKSKK